MSQDNDSVLYAIGDVHGRDDLLEDLYTAIRDHHGFLHGTRPATLIHIGDYIDRGPDSAAVMRRAMAGLDGFRTVSLLGNHEEMMLTCLDTDDLSVWAHWIENGGAATLRSLGVFEDVRVPSVLEAALGSEWIAWLRGLPLWHQTDRYLFVHAGIVPGIPLADQTRHDLLWIRGRFLDSDADHGRIVVHGHTPSQHPEFRANRINLDTGAFASGKLTCAVLDGDAKPLFIRAEGDAGI